MMIDSATTLVTAVLILLNVNVNECMELRSVTWVPVPSSDGAKARAFHVGAIVDVNATQYAWYLGGVTNATHELCDVDMLNLSACVKRKKKRQRQHTTNKRNLIDFLR